MNDDLRELQNRLMDPGRTSRKRCNINEDPSELQDGGQMSEEMLAILLGADDLEGWDYPRDWAERYASAMQRVRRLTPDLEAVLGDRLALDDQVQDASYFTELSLVKRSDEGKEFVLGMRFSHYGDLVAFVPWCTLRLQERTIEAIIRVLRAHGFVYVDQNAVLCTYSGEHPGSSNTTWWKRYFEYD
jgi:hypothetical protein